MKVLILVWWELNSLVCESWFKQHAYGAYLCLCSTLWIFLLSTNDATEPKKKKKKKKWCPSLGGKGTIKTRSAQIKFTIVATPKKLVTQIVSSVSVNLEREKGLSSLLLSLDPYRRRSRRLTVRVLPCCQLLSEVLGFLSSSSPGNRQFSSKEDPADYTKTVEEVKFTLFVTWFFWLA